MTFRILELGSSIAPAHAGLCLADAGMTVEKWAAGGDPMQRLRDGHRLWEFYTRDKTLVARHSASIVDVERGRYDGIIDNHTARFWERHQVDPAEQADRLCIPWVSIVSDLPDTHLGRSFDVIAQARAFGIPERIPFFIGDTAAGLVAAFTLASMLAQFQLEHRLVPQAAALASLREGGLDCRPPDGGWDHPNSYYLNDQGAVVIYRDGPIVEPLRDDMWRRRHLSHRGGRFQLHVPSTPPTPPVTRQNDPVE